MSREGIEVRLSSCFLVQMLKYTISKRQPLCSHQLPARLHRKGSDLSVVQRGPLDQNFQMEPPWPISMSELCPPPLYLSVRLRRDKKRAQRLTLNPYGRRALLQYCTVTPWQNTSHVYRAIIAQKAESCE